MSITLRISLLLGLGVYFFCLFYLLKKDRLELRYTILWIFAGVVMLLELLFSDAFMYIMKFTGIVDDVNGVFALIIFFLIIILMSITAIVSKLNGHLRRLTQKCALYEKRIRELENRMVEHDEN